MPLEECLYFESKVGIRALTSTAKQMHPSGISSGWWNPRPGMVSPPAEGTSLRANESTLRELQRTSTCPRFENARYPTMQFFVTYQDAGPTRIASLHWRAYIWQACTSREAQSSKARAIHRTCQLCSVNMEVCAGVAPRERVRVASRNFLTICLMMILTFWSHRLP